MCQNKFLITLILSPLLFLNLNSFILAATPIQAPSPNGPPPLSELQTVFANVISVSVALAGLALFIVLISGGLKWATAGGDPKQLSQAQSTITFGIIGFILFAAALLILQLISQFTGVDVTIFRLIQ